MLFRGQGPSSIHHCSNPVTSLKCALCLLAAAYQLPTLAMAQADAQQRPSTNAMMNSDSNGEALAPVKEISTLFSLLTPEAIKAIGKPLSELKAEGHEISEAILKPMYESRKGIHSKKWTFDQAAVNALMQHRVSLLGGYPEQELGKKIDWFRVPSGDLQWPTHLSRHTWMRPLVLAWRGTLDPKYSAEVIAILRDWIQRTPLNTPKLSWGHPRSAAEGVPPTAQGVFPGYCDGPWISLSAHTRADFWLDILPLLWDAPQMTNETTAILLNSLMREHLWMMINFDRWHTANQYLSVAASLVRIGALGSVFKEAGLADKIGWERILRFAETQVYPDGSMAECSFGYSSGSAMGLWAMILAGEQQGKIVPQELRERVRLAMRYFIFCSTPAGNSPRISKGGGDLRKRIGQINLLYHDSAAKWLASEGKDGNHPQETCYLFPWAGHAVMRSGWESSATWLFFEPGPRGSGHHDLSQLGIQLIANGDWLLVDPGYYTYSPSGEDAKMGGYLHSSAAHNVALVDGEGQISGPKGTNPGPNRAAGEYQWTNHQETCSATGLYAYGFGEKGKIKVTHRRSVTYDKNEDTFLVSDKFEGEGTHRIDLRWQCAPEATVTVSGNSAKIAMPNASLKMTIDDSLKPVITLHKGEKNPFSGWFSEGYGKLTPTTSIHVAVEKSLPISITSTLQIQR